VLKTHQRTLYDLIQSETDGRAVRNTRIIGYLPGLYPDRDTYKKALEIIADSGIRVMEIGIPGAIGELEGGVIADALRSVHRTLPSPLDVVSRASRDVRQAGLLPIVMAFRDTVFGEIGHEAFIDAVIEGGASLVLVPDAGPEEYQLLCAYGKTHGVQIVPFASAAEDITTDHSDAPLVYYQTADMQTGGDFVPGKRLRGRIKEHIDWYADVPAGVGFGIRTADDVRSVHQLGADFAIIGTAMVEAFDQGIDNFKKYLQALTETGEGE